MTNLNITSRVSALVRLAGLWFARRCLSRTAYITGTGQCCAGEHSIGALRLAHSNLPISSRLKCAKNSLPKVVTVSEMASGVLARIAVSCIALVAGLGCRAGVAAAEENPLPAMPQYFLLVDPHASAGDSDRGESVSERPHPELSPLGKRIGSFFVFPQLRMNETATDNLYASGKAKKADLLTEASPSVSLSSNWTRHSLYLSAVGHVGRFLQHSSENYNDYEISGNGRIDVSRDTGVTLSSGFQKTHVARGTPDEAGGKEPMGLQLATGTVQVYQLAGRLGFTAEATAQRLDYENVLAITQAGRKFTIDTQDRDRNVFQGLLGVSYQFSPNYAPFVRFGGNLREYDQKRDHFGFQRSSRGFDVVGGATADLGGLLNAEVFAGYQSQFYNEKVFGNPHGLEFGARLLWNVTGLTSITASARRTIQDIFAPRSASAFYTQFSLSANHELLRNLLLGLSIGYDQITYQGLRQIDDYYGTTGSATYMMNRHLYLGASYAHRIRTTSGAGGPSRGFDQNLVQLRLTAQF